MGGKNKRDHLIKAGQEVIWSKGYDLCSVKDITVSAGLPKGSFYHYFDSKEKFALEAMNDYIDSFNEKVPSEDLSLDSLENLLDKRIKSIVKLKYARECYMSVMIHAYSEQEDGFRLQILKAIDQSNETMKMVLTRLKTKGLIDDRLEVDELMEFVDFSWRGARLKARLLKSKQPLELFKKYLLKLIQKP